MLRPRRRPSTPSVSLVPRTTVYRTPGRSGTRPPRTSTTLCSCRLCPSPGMYAVTSVLFDSRTRAIFRMAEFGLRGVITRTCRHTPLFCGAPRRRERERRVKTLWMDRNAGDLPFERLRGRRRGFLTSWLSVGKVFGLLKACYREARTSNGSLYNEICRQPCHPMQH